MPFSIMKSCGASLVALVRSVHLLALTGANQVGGINTVHCLWNQMTFWHKHMLIEIFSSLYCRLPPCPSLSLPLLPTPFSSLCFSHFPSPLR